MRTLILLMTLVLSATTSAAEMEEECRQLTQAKENLVIASIPEMSLDEVTSTTEDLAVMSGLYNDIGRSIGGITSASPLFEVEVIPNMALLPDHRGICARPAVKVKVGYRTLGVYMDREIPRASCIYNAIFAHEMHHVTIYKDYIAQHLDQVKQGADMKFDGSVYFFETLYQAKQYLEILGDVFAQKMKTSFFRGVNVEQAALDTQAEYSRMQSECMHP